MNYTKTYYNLFQKKHHLNPPVFETDENYIMRFNRQLDYYAYNGDSLTLIFFKKGAGNLIIDKQKQKINNNQFIIANPNSNWEYINERGKEIDVLSFVLSKEIIFHLNHFHLNSENRMLDSPFKNNNNDFFFTKQTFGSKHYQSGLLLEHIYQYSNSTEFQLSSPKEISYSILESIFHEQLKAYKLSDKIKAVKKSTRIEVLKRLLIAYEYIHDNLSEQITIKELSLISGLSEYHLYHSFKRVFGKTPHQYISFHRMQKAKEMLERGTFTVTEVAFLLNFPDLATFSKLYKKTYGIPPSLFAK